ncbi:MAG: anti-sigma regulatory factor [Clostridium sp.]|nr:anti-sigma regulatory factor [Clostridium sp.]
MESYIVNQKFKVEANNFNEAGKASSEIKLMLKKIGINSEISRRIAIASYESEMNIVIHSVGGEITLLVSPKEIMLISKDYGPGIEDIEKAMIEGYSTADDSAREMGFGAGMGLCNIKRCSDSFKIESEIGKGTTLYIKIYMKKGD